MVLDWVTGPNIHSPQSIFGFSLPPVPATFLVLALQHVLGPATFSWLFVIVVLLTAWLAIGALVNGSTLSKCVAGVFYVVNPFVFERFSAGQMYLLMGYALLPLIVRYLLADQGDIGLRRLRSAILLAVAMAFSVHFFWIAGLVFIVVLLWRHRWSTAAWGSTCLLGLTLLNAYLVTPFFGQHQVGVTVGSADLHIYRTAADSTYGLFVNVLGLYGFWRTGAIELPKQLLPQWPIILLAVIILAAIGVRTAWQRGERELVGVLSISAAISYFLALGTQGPTGSLFRLMYDHVPGFDVMREPEKFSCLIAVFYAVFCAYGLETIFARARPRPRVILTASIGVLLPFAYTPTILDGLNGQLQTTHYPSSWSAANRLMGSGSGSILFLPWHEYLAFPFTHRQVIANPASDFFSRPVISGDNVEAGPVATTSTSPRSSYLTSLFADGPSLTRFGHLIAQLGASYIVLSHAVDFQQYGWLYSQQDLQVVYSTNDLTVWRNTASLPEGTRSPTLFAVASRADYIADAQQNDLVGSAVVVSKPGQSLPVPVGSVPLGGVHRKSETSYQVDPGPVGWAVLPEAGNPAWQAKGRAAIVLADGVAGVPVDRHTSTVEFTTWTYVEVGYFVSGVAAVVIVAVWVIGYARQRRRQSVDDADQAPALV